MADDLINSIVDRAAVSKQLTDTTAEVRELQQSVLDTAKEILGLNAAIGKAGNNKEFTTAANNATNAVDKLSVSTDKQRLAEIKLQQQREKNIDDYNKKLAQQAAAQEKANQAALKAADPYTKLRQSLVEAEKSAQSLGAQFGSSSPQYLKAAEGVGALRKQVDDINQPLGKFQDNVGNYGSAFTKFYGYVRTAANILPGIGISGIFLGAFEGIKFAVDQLGLLDTKLSQTAQNQQALNDVNKEADKQAGQQITRLQYLYKAATDVSNSTVNRKLAVNELQREFPNYFKNISDETILNGGAKKSYEDLSTSIVENARALAAANKTAELRAKIFDSDVQITKIQNANFNELKLNIESQVRSETNRSRALGATISKTQEAAIVEDRLNKARTMTLGQEGAINNRATKAIKQQDDLKKAYQGTINVIEQAVGGSTKIGNALAENKDNTPKTPKAKDTNKSDLDEQLKAIKQHQDDILADETKGYDERLQATKDYQNQSDALIEEAENKGVLKHQQAENMIAAIDENAAKERKKLQDDGEKELEKLFNDQLKNAQEHDKRVISDLNKTTQQRIEIVSKGADEEQLKLALQFKKGEISRSEYEEKTLEISTKASAETLKIQLEQLKTLIASRKAAGQDTADEEAKSAAIRAKIDKDLTDEKIKNAIKEADLRDKLRKELKQKEQEIADALINLAQTVVDASFKNQQDKLTAQSDAIDKQADADKSAVDRSLLTDKQKADKEKVIDAQAQLQKDQIAQASRKLAHDQAVADRAFSIASIVEHTAIAAIAALAPPPLGLGPVFGLPLAASIGALGAIQIATVLATPLPSYADGIDFHPGGYARFGEAGPELIIEPNRMPYLVGQETIGELPRGTEVISNREIMNAMVRPGSNSYVENQLNIGAILEELRLTRKQLSKSPSQTIQSTHITKEGFKRGVHDSEEWRRYLKRNNVN